MCFNRETNETKLVGRHNDSVNDVAIFSNNQIIVSGSDDMTVRCWNRVSGEKIILGMHDHWVYCISISKDNK